MTLKQLLSGGCFLQLVTEGRKASQLEAGELDATACHGGGGDDELAHLLQFIQREGPAVCLHQDHGGMHRTQPSILEINPRDPGELLIALCG